MEILLLFNPKANGGRSKNTLQRTKSFLDWHQINYQILETPENRDAAAPDWHTFDRAAIIGGDGTLHRVLNYWGVPQLPLCLISAGSGNDFSRLSHGSASLEKQLHHLLKGQIFTCDLGTCNDVWFATGVGIGFDGEIARILQANSRFKGHLAYYLVVVMQIFRYREKYIDVEVDGEQRSGASLLLTIGNGAEFGGGFRVTPRASFEDGIFQCCWIHEIGLLQRLFHLSKVEKGTHENLPFVSMFDGRSVMVRSNEELTCHMDGEVYQWKEFRVTMHAGAIQLIGR
ncbi:MAG: hypothetical protein GC180_13330 [Bacteroidetes bacterium]|nr:hypothetical protein [Bacteroidota bacterium]